MTCGYGKREAAATSLPYWGKGGEFSGAPEKRGKRGRPMWRAAAVALAHTHYVAPETPEARPHNERAAAPRAVRLVFCGGAL